MFSLLWYCSDSKPFTDKNDISQYSPPVWSTRSWSSLVNSFFLYSVSALWISVFFSRSQTVPFKFFFAMGELQSAKRQAFSASVEDNTFWQPFFTAPDTLLRKSEQNRAHWLPFQRKVLSHLKVSLDCWWVKPEFVQITSRVSLVSFGSIGLEQFSERYLWSFESFEFEFHTFNSLLARSSLTGANFIPCAGLK